MRDFNNGKRVLLPRMALEPFDFQDNPQNGEYACCESDRVCPNSQIL